jgi:hypothetical protein
MGYTNGQLFVFDQNTQTYLGFDILQPIPEPTTFALLVSGLTAILVRVRGKRP